jgi:hypothetical protein
MMKFISLYCKMMFGLAISVSIIRSFTINFKGRFAQSCRSGSTLNVKAMTRAIHSKPSSHLFASSSLSTVSTLTSLMKPSSEGTQFVFVGGKGGVGKTSSSAAIAIALSDSGLRTLLVSTDPAHSLGDALDVNLCSGNVVPITTERNLWALEIDVEAGSD